MGAIDRLHARAVTLPVLRVFTVIVRALLALAFVPSGLVKILGKPFTTLPTSDPVGYFFAGFFSAGGYYRFIGVAQWLAAGLLLMPRTATVGALVSLPIIVNIFAITVAIGPSFGGTRLVTGAMLLGNIYLLLWDWDRWRHILPSAPAARTRHGDLLPALGLSIAAGFGLLGVTGAHLARLRGRPYGGPLTLVALAALVGMAALVTAFHRAKRRG